jgi:hypothetical protein
MAKSVAVAAVYSTPRAPEAGIGGWPRPKDGMEYKQLLETRQERAAG